MPSSACILGFCTITENAFATSKGSEKSAGLLKRYCSEDSHVHLNRIRVLHSSTEMNPPVVDVVLVFGGGPRNLIARSQKTDPHQMAKNLLLNCCTTTSPFLNTIFAITERPFRIQIPTPSKKEWVKNVCVQLFFHHSQCRTRGERGAS